MKKVIAGILIGIIAIVGIVGYLRHQGEKGVTLSIDRVRNDLPVYTMKIDGDYYFDEFIAQGGASSDEELSDYLSKAIFDGRDKITVKNEGAGCSAISAVNGNGDHVWGRNFDWTDTINVIVQHHTEKGYDSITTCHFGYIVGEEGVLPEDVADMRIGVAALYLPLDGINEKGLCVADLQVCEGGMLDIDTEKPDLTITTAIRLILERAETVEEAVALLEEYDIHPSAGISHHIAVSDATGNAVVLEFIEGKMVPVPTPYVTNFNVTSEDHSVGGENPQKRYEILEASYNEHKGILEAEDIKETLSKAAQLGFMFKTRWSIIYDGGEQTASYYFDARMYEEPLIIKVGH